jgi:nucleoside-diphosphate-sugar epimerase
MYTIFGHTGFIGEEIAYHLKKTKNEVFLPKRNQIIFKRNLGDIIYCVGSDDWKSNKKKGYESNFGHLQKIIFLNKFKSIIFLSTTRLYINSKFDTSENTYIKSHSDNENNYYNILKLMSETLLLNFHKNTKIIRLSNVFGFNYRSPLVLPTLIKDAIKESKLNITININSTKDYISIKDVISLILKIKKKSKYRIYNVASGKNLKLKDLANIIKKETGCKIILKSQKKIIKEPKININRIKKEFKFQSSLDIKKDLPVLIEKFKN